MSQLRTNSIVPVGGIPAGASGGGIIQSVNFNYTTGQTFSSISDGSFQDTGLTASITPRSTSNKIIVIVCATFQSAYTSTANVGCALGLKRGASTITSRYGVHTATISNGETLAPLGSFTYLDSPATTSSTTYTVQIAPVGGTQTCYFNRNYSVSTGFTSTITLLEISG